MTPKLPIEDMPEEFREGYREGLLRAARRLSARAAFGAWTEPRTGYVHRRNGAEDLLDMAAKLRTEAERMKR